MACVMHWTPRIVEVTVTIVAAISFATAMHAVNPLSQAGSMRRGSFAATPYRQHQLERYRARWRYSRSISSMCASPRQKARLPPSMICPSHSRPAHPSVSSANLVPGRARRPSRSWACWQNGRASGEVRYAGVDLLSLPEAELNLCRGRRNRDDLRC